MRVILFLFLCGILHAQNPVNVDQMVEDNIKKITSQVIQKYNFRQEPGYYIPSFSVAFRFGGESLFNGNISNPTIPMFSFIIDARFMRFTEGFVVLRMQVDHPINSSLDSNIVDINLLNSSYAISGGLGGGYSFLDSRFGNTGTGNVVTTAILGIVGSRFGILGSALDILSIFGGIQMEFKYQYYFHRYASILVGFDTGFRFGLISTITFGGTIGFAF